MKLPDLPKLVAGALSAAAVLVAAPETEAMKVFPCLASTKLYIQPVRPAQDYHVQRGDTLGDIAAQFEGDPSAYARLAQQNNIADPNQIFVGQTIHIPEKRGPAILTGFFYEPGLCPILYDSNQGNFTIVESETPRTRTETVYVASLTR